MKLYICALLIVSGINYQIQASVVERKKSVSVEEQERLHKQWFEAVQNGQTKVVLKLISKVDVNIRNSTGETALIRAASLGRKNTVRLLLQVSDIDVNAQNQTGMTALMLATYNNHGDIVNLLVQVRNLDINAQNKSGYTALMYACFFGAKDIVKMLFQQSMFPRFLEDRNIALTKACCDYEGAYFNMLASGIASIFINLKNSEGKNALEILNSVPLSPDLKKQIAKLIMQEIADFKTVFKSVLFKAIADNNFELIKMLVNKIDGTLFDIVDVNGNNPLHIVFARNNIPMAHLILEQAADPAKLLGKLNKQGQIPLELVNPTSPLFILCLDLAYPAKTTWGSLLTTAWNAVSNLIRSPEVLNICANCSKTNCKLRCSKCSTVYYCGPECQKAHWQEHKKICKSS